MKIIVIVIVSLLAALGGGAWYLHHIAGPGVTYRTAEITRGEMVPTISASGTVEPYESVDVGAQVAGQIISFGNGTDGKPVDFRSSVEKDVVLAKIDPTTYQADEDTAKASLAQAKASVESAVANKAQMEAKFDQAKSDWDRAQALLGTEAMSKTDAANYEAVYKTAIANVAVAQAAIATANANVIQNQALLDKAVRNLDYCTITSPIKGTIIDRRVNVGQTVVSSLNTPSLFLIAKDLSEIQVLVSVNEADIGNVYEGQPVTFTVPAHPGRTFKGLVGKVRLNATMTQNVVTYTVEVNTHNTDLALFPYMTANVQFEVSRQEDVMLVPNAALRWYPQPEMVAEDVREAMANKAKAPADPSETASAAAAGTEPHPRHAANLSTTKPATHPSDNIQHGRGTLWVTDGKYVRPIKVRTGATDGLNTEISVKNDEVKVGEKVVVGEVRAQTADSTTNPFAPQAMGRHKH
ncbi:MAG TPA: efflux RND transporter periplasmic adaptor subunit [Tepidisphaeraceae bacterium]|jgi:HlyD family secretion protein|nr:efflux RND transporter periplasmic adaptor subunit [Tepidisphaeraceae bacterium]